MEDGLIKRMMTSIKCDSCGQHYELPHIDILGHREDMWFLKVFCPACHVYSLVAAIVREERGPEIVADLTAEEVGKFARLDAVGADDVLDMYAFLKDFDGSFSRLFGEE